MIKVLLCSNSSIKEQAIKKWFKSNLKEVVVIEKHPVKDKLLPPQPLNTGGKLCCSDRIREARNNCDINLYDYIIAIESSINTNSETLEDIVNVIVENCQTGETFETSGKPIEINFTIMSKYSSFIKILDDFIKNYEDSNKDYIYDGCEMTLGKIINHYYPEIPDDNWMKFMFNKDRVNQIHKTLDQISCSMKDDLESL